MNVIHILLVGAGGFIGSIFRYMTVLSIDRKMNAVFPYGTLTVNVVGSFVLGFLMAVFLRKTGSYPMEWKLFLATGFCGGFTTFSSFTAETMHLFGHKFPASALLYIAISVMGGLVAVWAGFSVARNIL
jgi:fluoride exporter